ncbi:Hemerythrin-like domain-containing protein [Saccharicrinis carchari]|uniref:Hemerythrin-like domain-containing protein n=1 Tax=Saccharicrinis carchari TaxID=1168039 RepID=A0A521E287_SACCC|nr:hemerythrin domain-containing protein [Saccharicrinis carchari]SMO77230.1 Hemerythrin-like domain-containing protein [Saccharicrinis carchari]
MNNITQILSDEHQYILKVISAALNECELIENGKEVDTVFFEKTIDFIKNYADKFHHAKEEDILFKAMLENVDGLHCNPIPVMLHEHQEGREYLQGMEAGLANKNNTSLIENTRAYGYLLQQHIYKEDNVLYPMAEQALSEEQKEQVNRLYEKADNAFNNLRNVESLKFV